MPQPEASRRKIALGGVRVRPGTYIERLETFRGFKELEIDVLALAKRAVTVHSNCGVMDKDVRSPLDMDEAISLLVIEPLYLARMLST